MAVWQASRERLDNFYLLASHVLVPPAIRALASSPENRVQGFIAPGHVCTVVGCKDYEDLVRDYGVPIVVGGFEPVDLLQAISVLVTLLEQGRPEFANEYPRSVSYRGNVEAQRILEEIFEVADQSWRGLGEIPMSGLRLREKFAAYDADKVFALRVPESDAPEVCISAEILRGLKKPTDCSAFGVACTPESPLGAPMVSSEGACSAYYQYRRHSLVTIQ
jgi:hydrogenase expression/formation protein HypD